MQCTSCNTLILRTTCPKVTFTMLRGRSMDARAQFQPGWLGRQAQWDLMGQQRLGPLAPGAPSEPLLRIYPRPCELLR